MLARAAAVAPPPDVSASPSRPVGFARCKLPARMFFCESCVPRDETCVAPGNERRRDDERVVTHLGAVVCTRSRVKRLRIVRVK